jgi:hypothetical protein
MTLLRIVRPIGAKTIVGADPDAMNQAGKHPIRYAGEGQSQAFPLALVIEEADVDAVGVFGDDRKIDAVLDRRCSGRPDAPRNARCSVTHARLR